MTSLEKNIELKRAIASSNLLSKGQKKILEHLSGFDHGASMSELMELMNLSKQALYFNVKKLLDRGFISRKKILVYVYQLNDQKMSEIVTTYKQFNAARRKI